MYMLAMKAEPGEVTSPHHPGIKDDDMKECHEINDSDDEVEEGEEGDLLEEEEVRFPGVRGLSYAAHVSTETM